MQEEHLSGVHEILILSLEGVVEARDPSTLYLLFDSRDATLTAYGTLKYSGAHHLGPHDGSGGND